MRCRKFLHSVSRLGKESKLSLLSLLTELYNFYFCVVSLSQNAHPVVFNGRRLPKRRPSKKLKRFVLVTQVYTLYNIHTRFSYYFFSVYVSLSKNSLSLPSAPNFSAKADAKVRTIFHPCKYFQNFFREKRKVFAFFDNTGNLHLIILYIERQKRNRHCCQFPSFTAVNQHIHWLRP